ncbi:MAG: hypothetical protein FJZ66_02675 [Bacteroidetes bacterium]|nr:hypothetical protein [Bacteroidota bacterium]
MLRKIYFLPTLLLLMHSCSTEQTSIKGNDSTLKSKFSNFVSNRENIIAFGQVNMFQVLEKSEYKQNLIVSALIDQFPGVKALNQDSPIYFAVEVNEQNINDINPYNISNISNLKLNGFAYAFIAIKNKSEIKSQLEKEVRVRFKNADGIDYAQENNGTFALFDDCMMVMVDLNDRNQVGIEQLKSASKSMNEGKSNEVINKLMASKSDFMLTYDMGKSVSSVLKGLKISNSETQQLESDLKGCFNTTNFNFENGKIVLTSENILSPAMSKWRITKSDSKEIVSTLGSGSPKAAIAMNLDVDQIQKILDSYLKSSMSEIKSKLSASELLEFNRIKAEGFSTVFNGRFGIAAFLKGDGYGFVPNVNFQLGAGKMLLEKLKEPLEMAKTSGFTIENKGNILYGYSGAQNAPGKGTLTLPEGTEDFGNYPINGFVDIQKLPLNELNLPEQAMKIIAKLSILKFKVEGDKFTLEIQFKDKSQNALAQMMNSVSGLSL